MTEHEQYKDDLKAYLDHELPLPRRMAVRRHVDGCASCREELMQMEQVTDVLERSSEVPDESTDSIDDALRARILDGAPPPAERPVYRPGINRKVLTAGAVASVILAAGIVGRVKMPPPTRTAAQLQKQQIIDAAFRPGESTPKVPLQHHFDEPDELSTDDYEGVTAGANIGKPKSRRPTKGTNEEVVLEDGVQTTGLAVNSLSWSRPQSQTYAYNTAASASSDDVERRVHVEASITVDVDDPEAKSDDVASRVKSMGGYVASSTLTTGDDGRKTAELVVKVPVEQFDTLMGEAAHMGNLTAKDVSTQDITDKVSDAQQREGVLDGEVGKAESRLTLLGKHSKWADAETARDLRIQLAQARARLVILKKLGQLADMDITLTQRVKVEAPQTGFAGTMGTSAKSAFESLVGEVGVILSGLIWIVMFAPIWIPLCLLLRWGYRRFRPSEESAPQPPILGEQDRP